MKQALFIIKNKRSSFLILIFYLCLNSIAQQDTILDNYVHTGLSNNVALKQKEADYRASLEKLQQAKGLFFPQVTLNARYTRAHGGRTITFPVGDLLNPVYQTLNMFTMSDQFPMIENREFNFYRNKEQYTQINVGQPIFNPNIYYNKEINETRSTIANINAETYKRQLVAEIKTAYFNYLLTNGVHLLLLNTKQLLEKNVRLTKSLHAQHKITEDKIFRAKAEVSKIEQQIAKMEGQNKQAKAYFNFLLNKDLSDSIIITNSYDKNIKLQADSLNMAKQNALNEREEISLLHQNIKLSKQFIQLNKSNRFPKLSFNADYGFQGEDYNFSFDNDFIIASIVLRWNLFKGFHNNAKIQEAKIMHEKAEYKMQEAQKSIQLEVINAYHELQSAQKSIIASQKEVKSTKQAFKIIEKKYAVGNASLLEFIDARTTMTQSEIALIRSTYDFYSKYAAFEKAAALYPVSKEP